MGCGTGRLAEPATSTRTLATGRPLLSTVFTRSDAVSPAPARRSGATNAKTRNDTLACRMTAMFIAPDLWALIVNQTPAAVLHWAPSTCEILASDGSLPRRLACGKDLILAALAPSPLRWIGPRPLQVKCPTEHGRTSMVSRSGLSRTPRQFEVSEVSPCSDSRSPHRERIRTRVGA